MISPKHEIIKDMKQKCMDPRGHSAKCEKLTFLVFNGTMNLLIPVIKFFSISIAARLSI